MSAWWMLWQKNGDLLPTMAVCKCARICEAGSQLWPQGQLNLPSLPSTRSRARKVGRSQEDVTQERSQGSCADTHSLEEMAVPLR